VLHLKEHLHDDNREDEATHIRTSIYEFTEFLTDVLNVTDIEATFPYKVGIHQSCHGQRGLKLAQMSELVAKPFSKPERLLNMVEVWN
jgi:L-lactate dehydrogenase complex protein LldE